MTDDIRENYGRKIMTTLRAPLPRPVSGGEVLTIASSFGFAGAAMAFAWMHAPLTYTVVAALLAVLGWYGAKFYAPVGEVA